ncbi:MAG: hypothetical protein WCD18_06585 [Thermosynechococcaceae cyanobacterium]
MNVFNNNTKIFMSWQKQSFDLLCQEITRLRLRMWQQLSPQGEETSTSAPQSLTPEKTTNPLALDLLCSIFNLSGTERSILILCAAAEIDFSDSKIRL